MDKETKTNLMFICALVVVFCSIFCGIALCIHVYGIHWANPEVQKAININKTVLSEH